jgi:hypothetical protein
MTPDHSAPTAAIALLLAALPWGCMDQQPPEPAADRQEQLRQEAQGLREELAAARKRLAERDKQVSSLLALGDKRLEKLYVVQRISLGMATGGIDLDGKAGDEGVKVYLQPIDQHGSVLKAPGEVTIQLYDLAAPAKQNLVGECRFDLDETSKAWSSGFLTYHYSFTCRWKAAPPEHDEITVRVEFLDYLTGKTYTAQKPCKIERPVKPGRQGDAEGSTRS